MDKHIPDHLAHLVLPTTIFPHIPDPAEIMLNGGLPGVEYALVLGQNVGHYTDPSLRDDERWELVRQPHVFRIGPANNVLIICRGRPINGADSSSSTRSWWVDPDLLDILASPPTMETAITANAINGDSVEIEVG